MRNHKILCSFLRFLPQAPYQYTPKLASCRVVNALYFKFLFVPFYPLCNKA